jgi:hypothetical protein
LKEGRKGGMLLKEKRKIIERRKEGRKEGTLLKEGY